jgi:hypothetical protein
MMTTMHFLKRTDWNTGEVKICNAVLVAGVEKEMRRPRQIAVLEHVDEWKFENLLPKDDGSFDVRTNQCGVVYPATRRSWAIGRTAEILRSYVRPLCRQVLTINIWSIDHR